MDFLSVREFRASSQDIRRKLSRNDDFKETLLTLRQVKAMRLFNRMRTDAQRRGFLSKKEIEAEIKAARIY
jgi:hypothetical protein